MGHTGRLVALTGLVLVCGLVVGVGAGAAAPAPSYSETTAFQGAYVYATLNTSANISVGDRLAIRAVEETGDDRIQASSQVDTVTVRSGETVPTAEADNATPVAVIDTDDLDAGEYFLQSTSGTALSQADDVTFTVRPQSLSASLEEETVLREGGSDVSTTDLTLDSTRGGYALNVTAEGDLSDRELLQLFLQADLTDGAQSFEQVDYAEAIKPAGATIAPTGEAPVEASDALNAYRVEEAAAALNAYPGIDNGFDDTTWNPVPYASGEADTDSTLLLWDVRGETVEALDGTSLSSGSYTLRFEAIDTGAVAETPLSIERQNISLSFDQSRYTQAAGDRVELTASITDSDNAYLLFGGPDVGVLDILYLEDENDDDEVTVTINTRLLGTPLARTDTDLEAIAAGNDTAESYIAQGGRWEDEDAELPRFYADPAAELADRYRPDAGGDPAAHYAAFSAYLADLGLASEAGSAPGGQLVRPLQPTIYPVAASGDPAFVINDGRAEPAEYVGTSVIQLTRPTLGNVSFETKPAIGNDAEDATTPVDAESADTQAVVDGDYLTAQLTAPGLEGALYAEEADADRDDVDIVERLVTLTDDSGRWAGEGVSFEITTRNPTGQNQSVELLLDEAAPDTVDAEYYRDEDRLVVGIDTADAPFERSVPEDRVLRVSLHYDATNERFEFYDSEKWPNAPPSAEGTLPSVHGPFGAAEGACNDGNPDAAYPYLNGASTTAVATIPVVEPTIDFADTTNGTIRLDSDTAVIGGSTPLADGTRVKVSVTSQQAPTPFERTAMTEVTQGTILSRMPLPEVPERTPAAVTVSTPDDPDRLTIQHPAVIDSSPPPAGDDADAQPPAETDTSASELADRIDIQAPAAAAPGEYMVLRATVSNLSAMAASPTVTVDTPSDTQHTATERAMGPALQPLGLRWPPTARTVPTVVRTPDASDGTVVRLPVSVQVGDEVHRETVTVTVRSDGQ